MSKFDALKGDSESKFVFNGEVETAPASTCDVLRVRIERSNNWLDAFTTLIFLVALAAAAMLIVAILSAADSKAVQAIVAGVGAVLSSGAFAALLNLRKFQERQFDHYVALRTKHNCPEV